MYGLIIGASKESIFAINVAKSMGMQVLAFDGNKDAEGLSVADEAYVVDIRQPELIYEILDKKQITRENAVVIPVPIGRYLISAGAVDDHYGLIGLSEHTANLCTDKYAFHQLLNRYNLRNAVCELIPAKEQVKEPEHYPVIIKPRFGAGSRGVLQIGTKAEWETFAKEGPLSEDYIVETAVEGTEYGIDAVVIHGIFHLVLARRKVITPPPARQCVGYYAVPETEETKALLQELREHMQQIVDKMEMDNCVLHADLIFREEKDEFFVIELSARPSGHQLHNLFTPLATGINMIEEYLHFVTSGECLFTKQQNLQVKVQPYLIHYFDMEDCEIVRIPSEEELRERYPIKKYVCNLTLGRVGKVMDGHSIMDRGYFILENRSEEELQQLSRMLVEEFFSKVRKKEEK